MRNSFVTFATRFPRRFVQAIWELFSLTFSRSEAHATARGALSEKHRKPSQGSIIIEVRGSPRRSECRRFGDKFRDLFSSMLFILIYVDLGSIFELIFTPFSHRIVNRMFAMRVFVTFSCVREFPRNGNNANLTFCHTSRVIARFPMIIG